MKVLKKSKINGEWINYEKDDSVKLKVRPFPTNDSSILRSGNPGEVNNEQIWDVFNYCIMDWKGIVDEDGKALECTEDNKRSLFIYDTEFIVDILPIFTNIKAIDNEIKNS